MMKPRVVLLSTLLGALSLILPRYAHASFASSSLFGDPSIVSYWDFDGNSNDAFGGNNGSDTNISYVSGQFGNAAQFNGVSSIINLGTSSTLNLSGDMTWNFWLKPSHGDPYAGIFTANNFAFITVDDSSCGTGCYFTWTGSANLVSASSSVSWGSWHLVSIVRSSGSFQYYLDGVTSGSSLSAASTVGGSKFFGKDSGGRYFSGEIDDVTVFSRALSPTELAVLYNSTPPVTPTPSPSASPSPTPTAPPIGSGSAVIASFDQDTRDGVRDIMYVLFIVFGIVVFYIGFSVGVYPFKNR